MSNAIKILMVEDTTLDVELAMRQLRREGLVVDVRRVDTRDAFSAEIENFKPDLILSDYSLPTFDGFTALSIAHERCPNIPFLFLSGTINEQAAIDALKGGAVDYVLKTNLNRLGSAVTRALGEARTRAAHMQAESRFRDLIEFAPHAIVVINEHGSIEIVNAQVELLFGYERNELIGAQSDILIPGYFRQWHKLLSAENDAGASPAPLCFEVSVRRKDGSEFPAEVSLSPLKTEDGLWVSSVIRDISVRKEQENRIARLSRIHTVLSGINTAIVRINDRKRFLEEACHIAVKDGMFATAWIGLLDPETLRLEPEAWSGVDEEYLMQLQINADDRFSDGRCLAEFAFRTRSSVVVHDTLRDPRVAPWRNMLIAHEYRSLCVTPLTIDSQAAGALVLYANQTGVFNDDEQRLLSTVAADISFALDHFNKEERLNYLAYFDPVTGLPNRALFQDRLGQLIARGEVAQRGRVAVVLLGLDRFRNINQIFGRNAADDLLREVAWRLREILPNSGYLSRIHADCFAFVLKGTRSEADVINLLERRVTVCLSEPVSLDKDVRISAAAGIVLFPTDGGDVDVLLRNAEAALKSAKASKSPYLFYTPEMNARAAEKLSIENRLRRALDEEQFVLHYQPKVDLVSGKITGLEALIRWEEPGTGLVLPDKFIHILEETGLIVDVGNWAIARARRQYQEWASRGIVPPRIAINVSQLQIRQKDFVDQTLRMLDSPEPAEFELEITESLFMDNADQNAAKLKLAALRENGITMAIDDFGTGYSSLSYIARLPIDTLKIDQSFIKDMATSKDHKAIVSTIISLAHSLKLKVVAEGVETDEQMNLLKHLKCDQVQGFFCGRSLPPEQIEPKLALRAA